MSDNSNNIHFSGVRFICSPYLAIKSPLASLGPIMARCGPHSQLSRPHLGGTSQCRAYGYVPPTRVDFSPLKIQNRPQIFEVFLQNRPYFLNFYSRIGSFFDNLVSNALAQMSKIPVAFFFCFLQPDVFIFVLQSVSSFL